VFVVQAGVCPSGLQFSYAARNMAAVDIPRGTTEAERAAMQVALNEARLAIAHDDVPVGAVILVDGKVVASAHNRREVDNDPTGHAEVLAIQAAAAALGRWRLDDATLVVTLEPCLMCAGAIVSSRIRRVVFGAADAKAGACGSLYQVLSDPRLHHEAELVALVDADESAALLTEFFAAKR
jgi:tRNA(adenine34) deaminase